MVYTGSIQETIESSKSYSQTMIPVLLKDLKCGNLYKVTNVGIHAHPLSEWHILVSMQPADEIRIADYTFKTRMRVKILTSSCKLINVNYYSTDNIVESIEISE